MFSARHAMNERGYINWLEDGDDMMSGKLSIIKPLVQTPRKKLVKPRTNSGGSMMWRQRLISTSSTSSRFSKLRLAIGSFVSAHKCSAVVTPHQLINPTTAIASNSYHQPKQLV